MVQLITSFDDYNNAIYMAYEDAIEQSFECSLCMGTGGWCDKYQTSQALRLSTYCFSKGEI